MNSEEAGLFAWEPADRLSAGEPSVQVRDDLIEHGYFFLDPCNLIPDEEVVVGQRIVDEVTLARDRGDGRWYSLSECRRRDVASLLKWPDVS